MKVTIARQIYADLREDITAGKLQPGHMLGEGTLADRYGSSKMPVREALHQLCQEGYLVSYPRRGYVVSNITEEDFFEIQQLRLALEMLSLELIVNNSTDEEILALRNILAQYKESGDAKTQVALLHSINTSFHLGLARLSKNKRLYETLSHLVGEASRAGYRFYSLAKLKERHFHERILDALLERDAEKAKEILREDLELPS
ncbi:MAG: GntR family transcriptional regulator [Spirochaetes bacterium]|nr:GntR family transcriptional regulator [Spirochaetota bacterium]